MYPVKVRTQERREGKDVRREEIQDKVKESVELRKYKRHGVWWCFVPLGLNWAAGKGAITSMSPTAHSPIKPADS